MKHLSRDVKQQLDWRLELSSQGYSEREISETIKVSDSTVHRDLIYEDTAQHYGVDRAEYLQELEHSDHEFYVVN